MEKLFREWLEETTKLSESSIGKYTRAIRAITKDMLSEGVIDKELYITACMMFAALKRKCRPKAAQPLIIT